MPGLDLKKHLTAFSRRVERELGSPTDSDQAAYKRITVARLARRFPWIFDMVADGRLHLSGLVMLSARLTSGNADELLTAATHKTKAEIEQLIAERYPRPDVPELIRALPCAAPAGPAIQKPAAELSPGRVEATAWPAALDRVPDGQLAPGKVGTSAATVELSPGRVEPPAPPSRERPIAPQRYSVHCTWDQETHDLYHDVRALMGHQVPSGDMALVLKALLALTKRQLEKRKFAATDRPARPRPTHSRRHIPAADRRKVRERDQGRCTFVSEAGDRCEARRRLEFHHVIAEALGGPTTAENLSLRCRTHNLHAAESDFGREHMERKRRGV